MALFQKSAVSASKTTQILLVIIIGICYLPSAFSAQIRETVDSSATTTATPDVIDISHSITKEYIPTANQGDCDVNQPRNGFMWLDYLILAGMLIGSCGIGLFYGFIGTKQTTSSDFLLGGSSMGTVPMAMSLAASFITAIELLGNPAEMYNHGTQFWMIIWAFVLVVPITSQLYLPVFMNLRLTSSFEYLAMRFNSNTRLVAAVLYSLQMIMYTSVAVYAPALALSKVTGLNVYIAVSVVYIVCVFYASQGGMKAVIIADSFQAAILVGSILLILVLGEKMVGGTGVVWSNSYNTDRLEIFNMDPNPTVRHSFWSVVIGGTSYWTTMYCANQSSIQKYLSVKTLSQARKALWITAFVLSLIYTINFYTGMIMVANWKDCDPMLAEEITASDQMLPYYVNTVMGHLSGMQGFFVAGIFAASLGTVAAALNSLAAITINDFMVGGLGINIPESKGALYAKWISLLYGILSFALVFVVEQLGSVMQIALSFNGMVGGVTLGLFSLGMFFPWCNSKGAITGAIVAMALVLWIGMGAQVKAATGEIVEDIKFVTAAGCSCLNQTDLPTPPDPHDNSDVSAIYRISYLWYSPIGIITTIVVGLVVSAFTGPRDPKEIDPDHMSPPFIKLYALLPQSAKEFLNLPLKPQTQKNIVLKGVINHGLDVNEEKMAPTQNGTYKVTGLNVYIAVSVVYIVCVFYASQGGMKAVIIADSFQAAILVGSILLILVLGEKMVGGTGVVWSNSYNTDRLEIFNMDPNPTVRHSFWSVVIGGTSYWTTMYCANQSSIQKYLSVKTLSQARKALWITAFVLSLIYTINFYTGMIMVANWKDCDPMLAEEITASDQMLPYYVNTVMGHLSGMQGFFVAGIFAASLGTVAAALNSLAAITINDFMVGGLGINIPESKGALYAKWISLLYGVLSFALVFVVEQLGSVMQIALSFNGMVGGVTLGLFSLGMFFPWCNSKGAITGAIVAMALVLWIGMGAQVKAATGEIVEDIKFVTAAGCSCLNQTDLPTPPDPHDNSDVSAIYRISYLWYSPIGIITTIVVGLVVSAFTGPRDPKEIDPDHMSPPFIKLYALLPQSAKEFLNLPLKPQTQKNIVLKGVINHGLDVNEEKMAPTQNGTYKGEVNTVCDLADEKPTSDGRKISTISKY